jgi:hypothetical protein
MTFILKKVLDKSAYSKASEAAGLITKIGPTAQSALLYLRDNYWQEWKAWVGAQIPVDAQNRAALLEEIERSFTPRPLTEEITERHITGVIGQEPSFEFVSARSSANDEKVLDAYEKIKAILRKRQEATQEPPPTKELPPADPKTAPNPEDQAIKAKMLADARDRLAIEEALYDMADSMEIEVEDDLVLPDDLAPKWKRTIEAAKVVRQELAKEKALLGEINSAFGEWWDRRKGHELLHEFLEQLLATGRAAMRFYIPAGRLNEAGELGAKTWTDALDAIYLEVPAVDATTVATDTSTMGQMSVYSYSALNADGAEESRAEITFLNEKGETVIRILNEKGLLDNGEAIHDCAGQLFVDMVTAKPLLTNAVQRNQNALNVVNTMLLHNSNLAGHRERNYVNLQRPKKEVADSSAPGGTRLVDDAVRVGARAANFLTGITYKDSDGNTHLAPGGIVITDPVDPKPLIEAATAFEDNILGAVSQMHTKISGDATASAVSRVQARFEHIKRLQGTSLKLEGVMRSRMVGVVALAMAMSDDMKDAAKLKALKTLRPYVQCHVNAGPLAPDERRVILEEYSKGVRSLESTQMMLGTEDVEGEMQKLADEREGSVSQMKERAVVVQTLAAAGASVESAALVAGFSQEQAKLLGQTDFTGGDDGE